MYMYVYIKIYGNLVIVCAIYERKDSVPIVRNGNKKQKIKIKKVACFLVLFLVYK